ncbi:hypothetical protein ACHOLT_00875 [Desulfitobacterium sp. Sab5]|uniref:hypothetical protein n=1 Tax=Desulfitobacterium nosdiversum TaxID=3375356 RepID=UPI003CEBAA5D
MIELLRKSTKLKSHYQIIPLKHLTHISFKARKEILIDTGFNQPECQAAMDEGIRELGFSMETTDILVTHVHGDHSGLVRYLVTPNRKVFCDSYTAMQTVLM